MPRGRHRHSPPLHRLLPPSVIAGVSVFCAAGPWLFTEPMVLRGLAAAAAVTTAVGAFVMRSWDVAAGKRVADLMRARASDEWQHEERVAELETDLEESRELRIKLEHKLRAKRTELANLRNEHAALLRRYATAETERASALEGRRLLAIDTTPSARALPAADADRDGGTDRTKASAPEAAEPEPEPDQETKPEKDTDAGSGASRAFSPEGSALFLRAGSALVRLMGDADDEAPQETEDTTTEGGAPENGASEDSAPEDSAPEGGAPEGGASEENPLASDTEASAEAGAATEREAAPRGDEEARTDSAAPSAHTPPGNDGPGDGGGGQPGSAEAPEAAEAAVTAEQTEPAEPIASKPAHSSGHFTVPTAVAVAPQTPPRRRPTVEGGFDFFGTQKSHEAMESVQNEDLADVVGQEALAVHKAESESGFKPLAPQVQAVGQVIDLTAHDETEQIDIQGLRTAAS
ncbi:hypothetical protein ABZ845_20880 [Streptomyces sp. NPDC047022]|uniref:hypothetical protein n=1 Tax=Streptomyces sp. NPDC047022 TaxID=3155737 RepID=UPI0033C249B0